MSAGRVCDLGRNTMRLTKLSLTNFRSFKETQTIDFAPVTMLLGPNSVGKSSVILALFYLQNILEKGECNPVKLEAMGNKKVDGFKSLIADRDLAKDITIKVEFDKQSAIGSTYFYLADYVESELLFSLSSPVTAANYVALEFVISWSKEKGTSFVSTYKVWFDDQLIAECSVGSSADQPQLTYINYLHPLLEPNNNDEWLQETFEFRSLHPEIVENAFQVSGIELPSHRDIAQGADDILDHYIHNEDLLVSDECFVSAFHDTLASGAGAALVDYDEIKLMQSPIGIEGLSGTLPKLGQKLNTSLSLDSEVATNVTNEILSDVLIAPLDNLLALLKSSLCIGPIRDVPNSSYMPNLNYTQGDWYTGIAAWDSVLNSNTETDKINLWMSSNDKLGLGYGLGLKVNRQFSEIKAYKKGTKFKDAEYQLEKSLSIHFSEPSSHSRARFDEDNTNYTFTLFDINSHMPVIPSEIGVGVSQLFPLIAATFSRKQGLVVCEQPELHVHPRIQVAIGDLLTQANKNLNFLIETHSEHIILRLLKRIRQTTDEELPEGFGPVYQNDISIISFENTDSGVKTKRIRIDEDGEFMDRWPHGFFSERREELM